MFSAPLEPKRAPLLLLGENEEGSGLVRYVVVGVSVLYGYGTGECHYREIFAELHLAVMVGPAGASAAPPVSE